MKRLIAAVALTSVALSASALEIGKPFEQLDLDRALPNIEFAPVEKAQFAEAAGAGSTRSDASSGSEVSTQSPWANDWNFIAPSL
jgi:hypothetical protein